jgi:predicted nucleic acid-binding protein
MARPILVDTDVLVDFFRGHAKAVAFINANSSRIILSPTVVAELYAGVQGDAERATLDSFISLFRIIPVGAEIAKTAGLYRRDYGKSHGVGLADAILIATTKSEKAELKTMNIKHYPMIKGLTPTYKK